MRRRAALTAVVVLAAAGFPVDLSSQAPARTVGLRIVVVDGEDAVNIIQQKTAVAPIVEVRDRNDQPVAGALVTFAIRGGKTATFANGAQTLSATTNPAGRAAVTEITPLLRGTYRIDVKATFESQSASATISQTNVATLAEAQAIGAGAAAGAGVVAVGAAAAGGGGGLSGVAIGAIAAAAGGGALVALKATGGDSSGAPTSQTTSPPTVGATPAPVPSPAPATTTYSGGFSGQWLITTTTASANQTNTCVATHSMNGTLTTTLTRSPDGSVTGNAQITGTQAEIAVTVSPLCPSPSGNPVSLGSGYQVSGNAGNLTFGSQGSFTAPTPAPGVGSVTCIESRSFSGVLANSEVTGTLTFSRTCDGTNNVNGVSSVITSRGTSTFPARLR